MKTFGKVFLLLALVLGAMMVTSCSDLFLSDASGSSGSTDTSGFTQLKGWVTGTTIDLWGREAVSDQTYYLFSLPEGGGVFALPSNSKPPISFANQGSLVEYKNYGDVHTGVTVGSSKYVQWVFFAKADYKTDPLLIDWSKGIVGYSEIAANGSLSPIVKDPTGVALASGNNIQLNIGDKLSVSVNPQNYDTATAYYVTTTGSVPADKNSWTANGKSFDVTYSGGNVYLFFWEVDGTKGASAFLQVNVSQKSTTVIPVSSISLPSSTLTIPMGGTGTAQATIYPSNATNQAVNYSSSNSSVVTVNSSSGVLTPVSPGTATITAASVDGNKTTTQQVVITGTAPSSNQVNLKLATSWAGWQVEITFADSGSWTRKERKTVGSDGRVPISITVGAEFSAVAIPSGGGAWVSLRGIADRHSYVAPNWSGTSVTAEDAANSNGALAGLSSTIPVVAAQ